MGCWREGGGKYEGFLKIFLKRGFFLITSNKWFSEIKDGGKKFVSLSQVHQHTNRQQRETQQPKRVRLRWWFGFTLGAEKGRFVSKSWRRKIQKKRTLKNRTTCLFIVSFSILSFSMPLFFVLFSTASTNWVKHHVFNFFFSKPILATGVFTAPEIGCKLSLF